MTADIPDPDLAGTPRSESVADRTSAQPYPIVWPTPPTRGESSPRSRRSVFNGLAVMLGVAVVTAVLGAPLGLLWAAVAPSVPMVKAEDGAVLADSQPEQFIAADGWFSLLGLGFGVLAAVAVWLVLRRFRGPVVLVAVVLGSLGAAWLAWRVGREIGLAEYHRLLDSAPTGHPFGKPPDLRVGRAKLFDDIIPVPRGVLLLPAFGAAVTYTLLAGWSRFPGLRPEPEPTFSWGSAAPRTPAAQPAPHAPDEAEPPRD